MSSIRHSQEFLQKRKLALIIPLFVAPVACGLFWLFDGGKNAAQPTWSNQQSALSAKIPDPINIDIQVEKDEFNTSLGSENKDDSLPMNEHPKNADSFEEIPSLMTPDKDSKTPVKDLSKPTKVNPEDESIKDFKEKLDKIYSKSSSDDDLEKKTVYALNQQASDLDQTESTTPLFKEELESEHAPLNSSGVAAKEEQKNTSGIFETSLDQKKTIAYFDPDEFHQEKTDGFYTTQEEKLQRTVANTIPAVVHESQTIVNGAKVKLRLLSDLSVQGRKVPKDSFVYGIASISNERLNISIQSIFYENNILPFSLAIYDRDGLPGIAIPGAKEESLAKSSLENIVQGIQVPQINGTIFSPPTFSQQLSNLGLTTAVSAIRELVNGQLRVVKVYVKANYKIYLK